VGQCSNVASHTGRSPLILLDLGIYVLGANSFHGIVPCDKERMLLQIIEIIYWDIFCVKDPSKLLVA
jgi:hypothetical protein